MLHLWIINKFEKTKLKISTCTSSACMYRVTNGIFHSWILISKLVLMNVLFFNTLFLLCVVFQLMIFGFMLCLDCFLFMFTFLPLRLIVVMYKIITGLLFCRTWVNKTKCVYLWEKYSLVADSSYFSFICLNRKMYNDKQHNGNRHNKNLFVWLA